MSLAANARRSVLVDPGSILDGDTPRLVDEWQLAPGIWNAVRRASDERRAAGQFILTGSASPADDITRHSGAGRIGHYRDETGLEVDAIVELSDGAWAAFEVKLGGEHAIEHAATSLAKLAERVDRTVRNRLRALAVITATGGYAYQRPDGVSVIPITSLGP